MILSESDIRKLINEQLADQMVGPEGKQGKEYVQGSKEATLAKFGGVKQGSKKADNMLSFATDAVKEIMNVLPGIGDFIDVSRMVKELIDAIQYFLVGKPDKGNASLTSASASFALVLTPNALTAIKKIIDKGMKAGKKISPITDDVMDYLHKNAPIQYKYKTSTPKNYKSPKDSRVFEDKGDRSWMSTRVDELIDFVLPPDSMFDSYEAATKYKKRYDEIFDEIQDELNKIGRSDMSPIDYLNQISKEDMAYVESIQKRTLEVMELIRDTQIKAKSAETAAKIAKIKKDAAAKIKDIKTNKAKIISQNK
jgi:hypothetical protein